MLRLKTRPQFQAVLASPVVAKTEHFALHRRALDMGVKTLGLAADLAAAPGHDAKTLSLFSGQDVWVGAMVPKRWAKRAVTRNAIKRQIYSVSAAYLNDSAAAAFLIRLRGEFSRKEFASALSEPLKAAVRAEVVTLMQRGAATV